MDCEQVGEGKSQVDDIIEHFNINAGNPAICMTQVRLATYCAVLVSASVPVLQKLSLVACLCLGPINLNQNPSFTISCSGRQKLVPVIMC